MKIHVHWQLFSTLDAVLHAQNFAEHVFLRSFVLVLTTVKPCLANEWEHAILF
jgi:hypothetical protein